MPLGIPRGILAAWATLAALALLWHILMPHAYYKDSPVAIWLEGPLPALVGVTVALWRRRAEPYRIQALAACAYAVCVMALTITLLGLPMLGFIAVLRGLWALIVVGFGTIFGVFWMSPADWAEISVIWIAWIFVR